jgi:hypothetical protein
MTARALALDLVLGCIGTGPDRLRPAAARLGVTAHSVNLMPETDTRIESGRPRGEAAKSA